MADDDRSGFRWLIGGYGLWYAGCVLFAVVAFRNDDLLSLIASVLFFLGVAAVMVPVLRERLRR